MINNKPKVSVIVLNWNRKDDTVDCVKSLSRVTVYGYELSVLVVDNGSTDDSVEGLNKITNFPFRIIKNEQNLGFCAGNNVGIKAALEDGADFIMLLNNDTLVDRGLIVQLLKSAERNKEAGVFCPKIYFAPGFEFQKDIYPKYVSGKVIWYAGGKIDWANVYASNFGVDDVDRGQYDQEKETDFATGCCFFVRRKVLERTGYLDEKLFAYMEDLDLSLKAKNSGWKVLYVPTAYLWHKVAQSSGVGSDLNDYFITRNRMLIGWRYAQTRTKFALFRESLRFLLSGRKWQKIAVKDFYLGRFNKGSWK